MGETNTSTQDAPQTTGQSSDAQDGSTSTQTFTEEQEKLVQKRLSDALAEQGREQKTKLDAAVAQAREAERASFKETQDRVAALEQKLDALEKAGGDDAVISQLIKDTRKELDEAKSERENLRKEKEAHDAEWQKKQEKIQAAFEIELWEIAEKYEGGDANRLKMACEKRDITEAEGARELADIFWTKKSSEESKSLTNGNPDSGGTSGGQKTWESIRDAYIQNPNDPKIKSDYMEARRKRGY